MLYFLVYTSFPKCQEIFVINKCELNKERLTYYDSNQ